MKMNMKKLIIIPAIIASFSLAACNNSNQTRAITGVKMWDQYVDGSDAATLAESGVTLEEYNNDTFIRTPGDYSLIAGQVRVLTGVFSFYAADFNNDGYRELCLGVSVGSGMIDERIEIYDYHNNKFIYSLSDRFNHDYYLTLNDGRLGVKETGSMKPGLITRMGSFNVDGKGNIFIDWDNVNTNAKYNLDINDGSRIIQARPHLLNKEPQTSFRAGEVVYFSTSVVYDADVVAVLNDTRLTGYYEDGCIEYSFVMPSCDSFLDVYIRGGLWHTPTT